MRKQVTVSSKLICEECNNEFIIPRPRAKKREEGHIKHMYCSKCMKVTAHIEKNKDKKEDFWEQWQNNQIKG
ncbi:ribosome associated inhibitor A [Staphylococcus phage PG-2021_40]|nr:hypothetical protein [Mammaliicoccus phage vB_MscM-PMS3]WBF82142.1 hypothetical protein [Mammaliicoccus virus vB_MscM-PMS2]